MKYFNLTLSSDRKIIGKGGYPQCKGVPTSLGLNFKWFDEPNSLTNLTNDDFPNFVPNLIFELEDKAFLTDAVSPSNLSAKGLLVSSRLKSILENFNLMEHNFYKATIIFKGVKNEYYWLHFKDCTEKYLGAINYSNSEFFIANLAFMKVDDIELNSYDDYRSKKSNLSMKHILGSKIKLSKELENERLDLFYFPYVSRGYFVSENLFNTIQENQITGFDIKKQNVV